MEVPKPVEKRIEKDVMYVIAETVKLGLFTKPYIEIVIVRSVIPKIPIRRDECVLQHQHTNSKHFSKRLRNGDV
jgi:hypothetical protein